MLEISESKASGARLKEPRSLPPRPHSVLGLRSACSFLLHPIPHYKEPTHGLENDTTKIYWVESPTF